MESYEHCVTTADLTGASHDIPDVAWISTASGVCDYRFQVENSTEKPLFLVPNTYFKHQLKADCIIETQAKPVLFHPV